MTNGGGHHLAKPAKSPPSKRATKPKTSGNRKKAVAEAKRT